MAQDDDKTKLDERGSPRTWRTAKGDRLVETGVGRGAFSRHLRDNNNAPFEPIAEYVLKRDGVEARRFRYIEGTEGWLAWATFYRVEGDRLLEYTFLQEDRSPWSFTVSVALEGLVAERG